MVVPAISEVTSVTSSVLACSAFDFNILSFINFVVRLIADDDLGGLHTLGIDLGAEQCARAAPAYINQLGQARIGSRIESEIVRGVALRNVKIQIVALPEQNGVRSAFLPCQRASA